MGELDDVFTCSQYSSGLACTLHMYTVDQMEYNLLYMTLNSFTQGRLIGYRKLDSLEMCSNVDVRFKTCKVILQHLYRQMWLVREMQLSAFSCSVNLVAKFLKQYNYHPIQTTFKLLV